MRGSVKPTSSGAGHWWGWGGTELDVGVTLWKEKEHLRSLIGDGQTSAGLTGWRWVVKWNREQLPGDWPEESLTCEEEDELVELRESRKLLVTWKGTKSLFCSNITVFTTELPLSFIPLQLLKQKSHKKPLSNVMLNVTPYFSVHRRHTDKRYMLTSC